MSVSAQTTLPSLLHQAEQHSPEVKNLGLGFQMQAYQVEMQLLGLRPNVSLTSNLPGFTRSINSITQPDGSLLFQSQSQAFSTLGLQASQPITLTGGRLSLTSGLNRIDQINSAFGGTAPNSTAWSSNLFIVSFSQPLFQFNDLRFVKQNAVLQKKVNTANQDRQLAAFRQQLAAQILEYYVAMKQLDILSQQYKSMQQTIQRTEHLASAGKILNEDVNALKMQSFRLDNTLKSTLQNIEIQRKNLIFHLGEEGTASIPNLLIVIDTSLVSREMLWDIAQQGSSLFAAQQSLQLAEQNIIRARQNSGPSANVELSYGFNQRAEVLSEIYQNPLDRQMATISLTVPIYDGGRNKYNQLMAKIQLEQATLQSTLTEQQIHQLIDRLLAEYERLLQDYRFTQSSIEQAQQRATRYQTLFEAGKITIDQYLEVENQAINLQLNLLQLQSALMRWRYWVF